MWPEHEESRNHRIVENGDGIDMRETTKVKKRKKKEKSFKNLPKKLRRWKTKHLTEERAHIQKTKA